MSQAGLRVSNHALGASVEILRRNSRSFALAARLLPRTTREDAAVVYAFCRQADDSVDRVDDPRLAHERLARLNGALRRVLRHEPEPDLIVSAFGAVLHRRGIPFSAAEELLAGMEMDLSERSYPTVDALLLYCYRAAGTVGWMMAALMDVHRREDVTSAVHLGIAMQLTNICRDVLEDWNRGRLYLPLDWLASDGAASLVNRLDEPFPDAASPAVAGTVRRLLALADEYYRSGDAGLIALPWRCSLAIRTARRVYSAIGTELGRRGHDVRVGRVAVSTPRKLWLLGGAFLAWLAELPRRWVHREIHPQEGGPIDGRELIRL